MYCLYCCATLYVSIIESRLLLQPNYSYEAVAVSFPWFLFYVSNQEDNDTEQNHDHAGQRNYPDHPLNVPGGGHN